VGYKPTARYNARDKQLIMTRGASVDLSVEFGRPLILAPICERIPGLQYDSYENMFCLLQHLSIGETCIAASHHHANFKTDNLVLRTRLPHHSHRPRRTDRQWLV